jgi:hypothetical protein
MDLYCSVSTLTEPCMLPGGGQVSVRAIDVQASEQDERRNCVELFDEVEQV